jgi:recombinational DNA repair ATPase RecF
MALRQQFTFNEAAAFDENIARFSAELSALDAEAGPVLASALFRLADATEDRPTLLTALLSALAEGAKGVQPPGGAAPQAAPPPAVAPKAVRWFLEGVEIEGFRGINNEGAPLALKFKPDCVNSISAPNAVGKSSIYDGISFALRGKIEKLDRLLQAERPQDYYLNRFHPGGVATIKLILRPDNGGAAVTINVTRSAAGARTVTGPNGIDAEALLAQLNREFVLLDGETFRDFIDSKALDRGRDFAGLLGLARYSVLRQQLQALANTRAFNQHFDTSALATTKRTAERIITTQKTSIAKDYEELVKEPLAAGTPADDAQKRCHAALNGMAVLAAHCASKLFKDVDIDACVGAIKDAEGGPKRDQLATVIREQAKLAAANKPVPVDADLKGLNDLARVRDEALKATSGDILRQLYRLSEKVMTDATWPSSSLCPTCEKDDGQSVLDGVRAKLGQYEAVDAATGAVAAEWVAKGWGELADLETITLAENESPRLRELTNAGRTGAITPEEATELTAYIGTMRARATAKSGAQAQERAQLEKELPPSLVAVTTAVEAARRLQRSWRDLADAEKETATATALEAKVARLKKFLDTASATFATAESAMAAARLKKVEPLCQELFRAIMFSPVIPALQKPPGSEEIGIKLAEFWGLKDLSAQALLSESYRNAFAVSVYLAAASLYGGAPRFMILDDVTSSFDAGHQHHLVEVIRARFARPVQADGPQVILLSHDTLLEKLFNRHSNSTAWSHQRLEGTARTAVLPQSGAVNKVRDATIDLLNAGRVDDAAPRVRQYLEYTLHDVIDRCRIPVPLDVAFGDDKRTPGEYLNAIDAAVKLHQKAGTLVLDTAQVQAYQIHSAAIIANFLAHWSTGQTQAFSAAALLGVMASIDEFPDCFKYEPAPGAAKKFYASLSKR